MKKICITIYFLLFSILNAAGHLSDKDKKAGMNAPNNIGLGGGNSGSGDSDAGYSPGQSAGMGFGGGRSDPTDKR